MNDQGKTSKIKKSECSYPDCLNCPLPECDKENKDIHALLKRRRYKKDPQAFRDKQNEYRARVKASLPHCNDCDDCALIKQANKGGYIRLCVAHRRLIEQKVSNSPAWCAKRKNKAV